MCYSMTGVPVDRVKKNIFVYFTCTGLKLKYIFNFQIGLFYILYILYRFFLSLSGWHVDMLTHGTATWVHRHLTPRHVWSKLSILAGSLVFKV